MMSQVQNAIIKNNMEKLAYDNIISTILEKFPSTKTRRSTSMRRISTYPILSRKSMSDGFENVDQGQDTQLAERLVRLTDKL